jgi:hypothetical protein
VTVASDQKKPLPEGLTFKKAKRQKTKDGETPMLIDHEE